MRTEKVIDIWVCLCRQVEHLGLILASCIPSLSVLVVSAVLFHLHLSTKTTKMLLLCTNICTFWAQNDLGHHNTPDPYLVIGIAMEFLEGQRMAFNVSGNSCKINHQHYRPMILQLLFHISFPRKNGLLNDYQHRTYWLADASGFSSPFVTELWWGSRLWTVMRIFETGNG